MDMQDYEFKEHTADIIARAHGHTLEQAFGAAARAMFDVITGGAMIRPLQEYEIAVESIDIEGLLVTFLSELIVLHEIENVVLDKFQVTFDGDLKLTALCRGETFDQARHGGGAQVKGVSYHLMEVVRGEHGQPCHVQVLFDI
jgi:SHS2 domain-containing protein